MTIKLKFIDFIAEELEKSKASIGNFLQKLYSCGTLEGINELEEYYNNRKLEVAISDTDDIQIRDIIANKKTELSKKEKEPN